MKKRFTIEQHTETGKQLFEMRNSLIKLSCDILHFYPKKSKVVKLSSKALKAMDALRSELDNCVSRENPEASNEAVNVYYIG